MQTENLEGHVVIIPSGFMLSYFPFVMTIFVSMSAFQFLLAVIVYVDVCVDVKTTHARREGRR